MPKVRSPNRDKAFEIYKQHNGDILLVDIAKELDEATGTIRGWKSKDKWDDKLNGTFQTKNMERSNKTTEKNKDIKNKSSFISSEKNNVSIIDTNKNSETNTQQKNKNKARFGNKNAVGNKGGTGAPLKNKNALVTGEHETILVEDLLNEKELAIFNIDFNIFDMLRLQLSRALVREERIEHEIYRLQQQKNGLKTATEVTIESEVTGDVSTSTTTTEVTLKNVDDDILKREEALLRVQSNILKILDKLHKFGVDYEKLDIEKERLILYKNKLNNIVDLDELIAPEIEDL